MKNNIFNKIFRLFVIVGFLLGFSCTDDFMEVNTNKTQFMEIGPKEYSELFARAVQEGIAYQTTEDMSRMSSTLALHNCGYIACGKQQNDQYMQSVGWQNSGFEDIFVFALPPILTLMENAQNDDNIRVYSVAQIWKMWLLQQATDIWGPIPYKEAGSGKESVSYDSQRDVYYMMFEELTEAVTNLKQELQNNPGLNVFGAGDRIYSGNVEKWIRFANTLRLRMASRISNVEPEKAKQEGQAAVAAGPLMETNADDALYKVTGITGNGNGMPRMESFFQDVMSTNMESVLKGYNDPRMTEYWSPVAGDMLINRFPEQYKRNVGGYHGFSSGSDPYEYTYFKAFSKYGPRFKDGNQFVTPVNVMNAAEAWFLKAEGAWLGWNMGGTAQSFYEKGIEISIKQWLGTDYSQALINEYINSTTTPVAPDNPPYYDPPMTNIPVKFAADKTEQYEQIMTQKWIALFPVGFEAWAEFRRTRLPKLYPKKYSVNEYINPATGQIQTRCRFVEDEYNANAAEIEKAKSLLKGGEDVENVPLWWDINPN
ncbi:MAG: SusD/RagB family nutrient-binding outer membrane lipoprotein [Mariniphaga sp.]